MIGKRILLCALAFRSKELAFAYLHHGLQKCVALGDLCHQDGPKSHLVLLRGKWARSKRTICVTGLNGLGQPGRDLRGSIQKDGAHFFRQIGYLGGKLDDEASVFRIVRRLGGQPFRPVCHEPLLRISAKSMGS